MHISSLICVVNDKGMCAVKFQYAGFLVFSIFYDQK